ncbi:hypothetical protein L3081_07505 [Colwellia sp. MSW7]|uniref:DUF2244 domain-containing protein n=1 Tax=Colwellia maritima TaxID=2912588 RepID=A0ABS9WZP1_9GAMM|nr:protein YgfX [Colwellia maritima]MCI2283275.1 hypothetical protein [Colwellia maritima]
MNLTPWCNLFSTASKYNIEVKKSRYKPLFCASVTVIIIALLLVYFTYAYHLILAGTVLSVLLLGILLAKKGKPVVVASFELDNQGRCSFDGVHYYQLLTRSRFSFLGCWLYLQYCNDNTRYNANNNDAIKRVFIFRDSLYEDDFSRLSNVISQLNYHD